MNDKFTPGPWSPSFEGDDGLVIRASPGGPLARVLLPRVTDIHTLDANAFLMAAAPDMLHALDEAAKHLNEFTTVVVEYLQKQDFDDSDTDLFVSQIIALSDGPERQRVAAIMNEAMKAARGETT